MTLIENVSPWTEVKREWMDKLHDVEWHTYKYIEVCNDESVVKN